MAFILNTVPPPGGVVPFSEDFDEFFDIADFAISISIAGTTVNAIFDHEYVEVNGVDSRRPVILFETESKSDTAQGDAVVINLANYVVEVIQLDGQGLTSAILRNA